MKGDGYIWGDTAQNNITLTGGTFTVTTGSTVDFGYSPTVNATNAPINLNGGNLTFSNSTSYVREGDSINVNTGTLTLNNTSELLQLNSAQITVGASGTMKITQANANGWVVGNTSNAIQIEDSGKVIVANGSLGSYYIQAPIHVTGSGQLLLQQNAAVEFAAFTGGYGGTTGTRGASVFMDGTSSQIQMGAGATITDTYGWQQDNGKLICSGTSTSAYWTIAVGSGGENNNSNFIMNGGFIVLGDGTGNYGTLGIQCGGTGQFVWYTGALQLGGSASAVSQIALNCCNGHIFNATPTISLIGDSPTTPITVIAVDSGQSVTNDCSPAPAPSGWFGGVDANGNYTITMNNGGGGLNGGGQNPP